MDFGSTYGQQRIETVGKSATTPLTIITAPDSTNTKGAWTELSASAPFDVAGFWVSGMIGANASMVAAIDIGIGGAASESVIVDNIVALRLPGANSSIGYVFIPLSIPAGTRIAARYQTSSLSSEVLTLGLVLCAQSFAPVEFSRCHTANVTTSGLTRHTNETDPGVTVDTKGAWAEMTASLNFDAKAVLVRFSSRVSSPPGSVRYLFDIGVGAAASEVAIVSDLPAGTSTVNSNIAVSGAYLLPIHIPAGTRISGRAQCSGSAAEDRTVSMVLHFFG